MIINIDFSGNEIKFLENNKISHYGIYTTSWFKHKKTLYNSREKTISTIITKIKFSGIKHIIHFDNEVLELKLKGSLLKNYYECFYKEDKYQIIMHSGFKTSLFLNDKQIAYYDKKTTAIFDSQKIILECNSNINKDLVYSFISAIELTFEQKEPITIDIGNIAKDYKVFNENWKPTN